MPTIVIGNNQALSTTKDISILAESLNSENEHIWIWDHYFSFALNNMGSEQKANELINMLSDWAKDFCSHIAKSFEELTQQNLMYISKDINIKQSANENNTDILIEITEKEAHWPDIQIYIPENIDAQTICDSVIALAHYFLENNSNFYRELPLHIVAMRKYFETELSFSQTDSIQQAPAYAFDAATKFYQGLRQPM